MKTLKNFTVILLSGALLVSLGGALPAEVALKLGSPPPPLELPTLNNEKIAIDHYLGKQALLLAFFTTWSKPCVNELEFLQNISSRLKEKEVAVLAVSFDTKSQNVQSFIQKSRISFPVLIDKRHRYLDDYQILVIPTLYVIGKNGMLKSVYVDFDDGVKRAIEKEVQEIIK